MLSLKSSTACAYPLAALAAASAWRAAAFSRLASAALAARALDRSRTAVRPSLKAVSMIASLTSSGRLPMTSPQPSAFAAGRSLAFLVSYLSGGGGSEKCLLIVVSARAQSVSGCIVG